jgi:hypothetical protein
MLPMTPSDLLDEFSIKIYEPPLSEIRDSGLVRDLSNPIAVVMLVVDFDTEVEMNGINNWIGNSTGLYAEETVVALEMIGCVSQAMQLKHVLEIAAAAGMTHDAIREDRSGLAEFAVTSFSKIHGDKWDAASDEISNIHSLINYEEIRAHAERYVAIHADAFHVALGQ